MTGNELSFLNSGGEMGARMRAHDWAATSLGSPDNWPQSLRTAISMCLNSPVLGTILWGPELIMLYNDAYIAAMPDRHPQALGCSVAAVWGDTWKNIEAPFYRAMATGEGFAEDRVELPMIRHGHPETTYWDITACPIRGEDGGVAGLYNQGFEITSQIIAERERATAELKLNRFNEQLAQEVTIRTGERDLMWDTAPDLMLIIDFDGILKRVNPAWTELLGYSQQDLVGHHVNQFVISEDHPSTVSVYKQAARGEQSKIINRAIHTDGSVRWISWLAAPAGNLTYAA
ncbi:MAG: PAS domain S-box-containing protein, partial [Halopseudomonas sp.]